MSADALIVFARPPVVGKVKTRLTELISSDDAADLYRAFLHDALAQYATLQVDMRLYLAEEGALQVPSFGASTHLQRGSDLGARMLDAFLQTRAAGYGRIVIIGTDHPTLPSRFIGDAFKALATPPAIAIGPTEDGGYYLLGMAPVFEGLFNGIVFSRPDVFAKTLKKAQQTSAQISELPTWFDVDHPADLKRLLVSGAALPPRTAAVVRKLARIYAL